MGKAGAVICWRCKQPVDYEDRESWLFDEHNNYKPICVKCYNEVYENA